MRNFLGIRGQTASDNYTKGAVRWTWTRKEPRDCTELVRQSNKNESESSEGPPPLIWGESTSTDSSSSEEAPSLVAVSKATPEASDSSSSEGPPSLVTVSESSSETFDTESDLSDGEVCKDPSERENEGETSDSEGPPPLVEVSESSTDSCWSDTETDEDVDADRPKSYQESYGTGEGHVQQSASKKGTALDSGATEQCASCVKGELGNPTISSISGLSGDSRDVTGMNNVKGVHNVMCIPGISTNLLSVGRLLDQYGGEVCFTRKKAHLKSKRGVALVATRDGTGLYIVCDSRFDLNDGGEAHVATSVSVEVAKQRILTLHRAYGHASKFTMQKVLRNRKFDGLSAKHLDLMPPCEACLMGKAHKASRRKSGAEKATKFAERLCADCTGPFRTKCIGGSAYLLVVVDEFSAWTWVTPMRSLELVSEHLTTLLEVNLHQRDDSVVKFFRSDGGTEFTNTRVTTLLAKLGIVRETTCPNTSYQNGKAERRIRTVFDRVRTVLSDAGVRLSTGFWADAAVYAAYTLNRTPSEEEGKTPFEMRYNKRPKISHLRPFGNPCVVYRARNVAGKVKDAGVKGTFLDYGYVNGKRRKTWVQGAHRAGIVGTNKVVTTRDVAFCAYEVKPVEVATLVNEPVTTPDAVITTPANAEEVSARLNLPVAQVTNNEANEQTPVITVPSNAGELEAAMANKAGTHSYTVGAKVMANWRGHGKYYPAVVTGVHTAGMHGNRSTYDLVYETDGESEAKVSKMDIRPRGGKDNVKSTPSGHALMTDCHPAYLADVPDLTRSHVTPKHYGQASRGPDKVHWTKSRQNQCRMNLSRCESKECTCLWSLCLPEKWR